MADLETGERRPTGERLRDLIEAIRPAAGRLGCAAELATAAAMVEGNGAIAQREAVAGGGAFGLARWLADRFLEGA